MAALPLRTRWGFALGDTGFNFVWQSIELYLLFFYTHVLGLPVGWAAAIFFVGAVVDWISDPVIGALADRTASRTGRMRAWLLGAAPAIGIALVLAFSKPAASPGLLFGWALASHLLLRIAYSAGNIPYAALTARITADPGEQARLTGLRMQCAALGGLTVTAIYWGAPELAGTDRDASRFLVGALLLGLLMQPLLFVTWRSATEIVRPRGPVAEYSFARETTALIGLVRQSAPLRRLLLVIVFAGLTTSLVSKSIMFLFALDLGRPESGYPATFLPALALLLATPLWMAIHDRTSAPATLAIAAVTHAAGVLGLTLSIALGGPIALAVLFLALAIVATTGLSVMFWAMVPPVALDASAVAGDCEGRVYALATTARKLAQALASPMLALGFWAGGAERAAPVLLVVALVSSGAVLTIARVRR